ncbi:hypothetical protein CLF_105620 [Clonorchis sinensis]|uniref:Uncharacterized protein n=1 Tax=Clonorchis sinensis TaxID=79923 RepID=G7YDU3_CLOSI|nr:hypothetical protein CLF_105620 [Clonorchis sinensis]
MGITRLSSEGTTATHATEPSFRSPLFGVRTLTLRCAAQFLRKPLSLGDYGGDRSPLFGHYSPGYSFLKYRFREGFFVSSFARILSSLYSLPDFFTIILDSDCAALSECILPKKVLLKYLNRTSSQYQVFDFLSRNFRFSLFLSKWCVASNLNNCWLTNKRRCNRLYDSSGY